LWGRIYREDSVALVLGDNIFFGSNMDELLNPIKPEREELFCIPRFGPGTIRCGGI
jgi:dTDP-glucose pyrophosphorylase